MKKIPRLAKGRRNQFFDAGGVDELMSMVLELTAEVSVLRERQYATERILEQHNLPVGEALEAWQPTEADQAHLEADRERLIGTVLRTLEADSGGAEAQEQAVSEDRERAA